MNLHLPEVLVDSYDGTTYNTYFYQPRDLQLLNRYAKQNTMSVGELLVRFFWYYGFEFDYVHSVVTIRQRGVLDREETLLRQYVEDEYAVVYRRSI